MFCIFGFAFWEVDLGLLGLVVFVPYLVAGVALSRKGLCLGGNTYVLFGAVFGSCGGLFSTFDAVIAIVSNSMGMNLPFRRPFVQPD